jgi:Holliday junction resolvase RusA-like endonuclease
MNNEIKELSSILFNNTDEDYLELISSASKSIPTLNSKDLQKAINFVAQQEETNGLQEITFVIQGKPPSSKRPRSTSIMRKVIDKFTGIETLKAGVRVYASDGDDQLSLKTDIFHQLPKNHIPYLGEVELELYVYKPMLQSWPNYKRILGELGYLRPDKKPDYDNYSKIITDAMRDIVFADDSQVVIGDVKLLYSVRPRLEVIVRGRANKMSK